MPVLGKKALLVLSLQLTGVMAAMIPRETVQAGKSSAPTATMLSSTPTPTAVSTTASVPEYTTLATAPPAPTSAPELDDDAIMAAAITIPIPFISLQTWYISPSLRIDESFSHTHEISRTYKEDDSWTYSGGSPVRHGDKPKWHLPDANSKGTVKVATVPDENGYVPPVYNGPLHGNELPKLIAEVNDTDLTNLAAAAGEAPSAWKIIKDVWGGSKEPQTVNMGNAPAPRPLLAPLDRTEDDTIPSVFGLPEGGHINGKNINPVTRPKIGAGWIPLGDVTHVGHKGSSTVTVKDGFKTSEGDSVVESKENDDSLVGGYTGLGVAEYNKARKILDYFHHGKHFTLKAAMEVAMAEETGKDVPSNNATAIATEGVNKTLSKHVPRDVVKHMLNVPVVSVNTTSKTNTTTSALDIVKKMMEVPVAKNNKSLKKILEVVYRKLNKTSSAVQPRGIAVDPQPVKHVLDVPVVSVNTTSKTNKTSSALDIVKQMMEVPAAKNNKSLKKILEAVYRRLNKTSSTVQPRGITVDLQPVEHTLSLPVVSVNTTSQTNTTTSALDIVKQMMEVPAAKNNKSLKKILEAVYRRLNKTSSAVQRRGIFKHMLETIVDLEPSENEFKKIMEVALPTTLLTVTRTETTLLTVTRTKTAPQSPSNDVAVARTTAMAGERIPLEDYYHRYPRFLSEEGVSWTFHADAAATTWTSAWVSETQSSSASTKTYAHDDDGAHYRASEAKTDASLDRMEDSPVFDDPNADAETNADVHDELNDMKEESKEMSKEIDEAFKHEFGYGGF